MAQTGHTSQITTVSRRGKPGAPGPAAAFLSVMAQESVHYMAACDQTDAKAVECLTQWAAPVPAEEAYDEQQSDTMGMLQQVRSDLASMGPGQLSSTLKYLEETNMRIVSELRQTKTRLQRKDAENREALQSEKEALQEQEASALELIGEVQSRLN